MKYLNISIWMLVGLLWLTGCSKDELLSSEREEEVMVSFKTCLDATLQTRANGTPEIGKGGHVDIVKVAVYQNGEISTLRETFHVEDDGKAEVNLSLVKGQTYDIVFWAQNSQCSAYTFNENTPTINVNYDGMTNNKDVTDAFFGAVTGFKVENSFTKEVTLRRPFAQINVGSLIEEDYQKAVAEGFIVTKSSVTFSGGVGNLLNLLTGEVTATDQPVSLALSGCPFQQNLSANNASYKYLSMNYLLVADDSDTGTKQAVTDVTFTFKNEGDDRSHIVNIEDLPIRRNYQTNVTGLILTAEDPIITMQTISTGD